MENEIYLFEEFKEWLKDNYTSHVASNYASWLKKINREFISKINTGTELTPIGLLFQYTNPQKSKKGPKIKLIEELLYAIGSRITSKKKELKGTALAGEFNSESTAFNTYAEFVIEYTQSHPYRNDKITPTEIDALAKIAGKTTKLDQQTIINTIFTSRLNTQDRITGNKAFLPIGLIESLFPKETRKWVKEEAARVRIHLENSSVPITKISEIHVGTIDETGMANVTAILDDGSSHIVYNPPINDKKEPMQITIFSDTDIDHDREIHDILTQLKGRLPGLDFLTERIKAKQKELGISSINSKNCNGIYSELLMDPKFKAEFNSIKASIPDELKLISSYHGLQLASSKWNRSEKKQAKKH